MPKPIPEGLRSVTPQITIDGCAEAIEFYKKALGAVEVSRAPDPSGKKVWHAEIRIGDSAIFVNDTFPEMGGGAAPTSMWLYSAEVDAAFQRAVAAGAKVLMPVTDMFWGDRMGTVADKWSNRWSFAQRVKDLTPDEMRKAGEAAAAEWAKGPKK
jgi:PhnB protein